MYKQSDLWRTGIYWTCLDGCRQIGRWMDKQPWASHATFPSNDITIQAWWGGVVESRLITRLESSQLKAFQRSWISRPLGRLVRQIKLASVVSSSTPSPPVKNQASRRLVSFLAQSGGEDISLLCHQYINRCRSVMGWFYDWYQNDTSRIDTLIDTLPYFHKE